MIFVVLGALAYLLLIAHDYEKSRSRRLTKNLLGFIGVALLIYSFIMLWSSEPRWHIPTPVRIAGYVGCGAFLLLLIYSLFIELPIQNAANERSAVLVDTGTYALTRHPGVLWLFGFLIASFAATGSVYLLITSGIWTAMDGAYVAVQERFFYPRIFGSHYIEYKRRVPMLVPNGRSMKRCLATLPRRRRS